MATNPFTLRPIAQPSQSLIAPDSYLNSLLSITNGPLDTTSGSTQSVLTQGQGLGANITGEQSVLSGANGFVANGNVPYQPNYGFQAGSPVDAVKNNTYYDFNTDYNPIGKDAGNPTQNNLFTGSDYINGALGGAQLGLGIYEQFFDPTAKKLRTAAADSAQSTAELNRAKVQNYKDRKAFSANIDEKALAAGREYRKDSPNYQKGL